MWDFILIGYVVQGSTDASGLVYSKIFNIQVFVKLIRPAGMLVLDWMC